MPGIIPSVEAALYKMNVNGAADVPHNGRRCQHYLRLRRLNSEQRGDRDDGLIFIITPAPTMVSHDLAKTTAVAMRLGGRGDMADTAVRNERAQSPSGAYGRGKLGLSDIEWLVLSTSKYCLSCDGSNAQPRATPTGF